MSEKYYKVIAQNSASPTKEFDYSAYLPSCDCAGIAQIKTAIATKKLKEL